MTLALHQVSLKVQTVNASSVNYILPAQGAPPLITFIDIQEVPLATG